MDTEILPAKNQRLLPAVVPVLLIAIGYVDPGKWAAAVEGGSRFGLDLVLLMLIFNFAAILCQYLSARIAMVSGRDLSQICSEEYNKATCILLGVLIEISMISLDLTMILGTAHGLNLIFGVDLVTCVFLTAIDALLFPVFATLLDIGKAKLHCTMVASLVLLLYVLGVLFSQPDISISTSGMLTKLSGESAFALMSLLGATIMPQNFYLHSSIVQQGQEQLNVSNELLFHDHFFAILSVFSGIFMVNYVLMNAAANLFYSTGLVLLTFQDALSLMDQVFRSSVVPFVFLLVLLVSNHITALTWNFGRQAVLLDFFGMDIPGWLHHFTIRIIAIIPALCCVWNSGAEGIYQLLIFTQVVGALLLPSSVIPLFRVASSRSVMGVYKISQFVEFLALVVFFGLLGLNIIFLVEMVLGNSDWVGNLRWNVGSSMSGSYIVLLVTASSSFCLMLYLAVTPLKSASSRLDTPVWNWDIDNAITESSAERGKSVLSETVHHKEESTQNQEPSLPQEKSLDSRSNIAVTCTGLNLPEKLVVSDNVPCSTTNEDDGSSIIFPIPSKIDQEKSTTTIEADVVSTVCSEGSVAESAETIALKTESTDLVEKTVRIEGGLQTVKYDDEVDTWELDEPLKGVYGTTASSTYDGPGSYRSLSGTSLTHDGPRSYRNLSGTSLTHDGPGSYRSLIGKSEDGGSGAGSLSRLAGLGRAARRQLATVLDEFWGQLFDYHGQATQEVKAKKLDVLLGFESNGDPKPATPRKGNAAAKEFTGYFSSLGGRGSDFPINSGVYDSPKLLRGQGGMETSYSVQRRPTSSWSSRMQLSDACVQNSSNNALDSGERRYSSLRLPPASGGNDYQPATVHGYQIASYLGRIAYDKSSGFVNGQMEALTPNSPSLRTSNYRDPLAFSSVRKPQNRVSSMAPPGFTNTAVSRNISLLSERQSEKPFNGLCSPGPAESLDSSNTKKFHSLPDISGLSLPCRELYLPDKGAQWDSPMGYGPSLNSGSRLNARTPLAFQDIYPPKPYRDPFTSQFSSSPENASMWSRQPLERFGVADKTRLSGNEGISRRSSFTPEPTSALDSEAKLLQSFRHSVVKLLKLEGSDWLFRQNDGADEDLIGRVAARERFVYEAETKEMNQAVHMAESEYSFNRKPGPSLKNNEIEYLKFLVSSVPHCGEGCVWHVELIISFGVWCIHRVLELSLLESRPELWGKYTFVLNRLQGIIDLAFSKPRMPLTPCFCLQIPTMHQQRPSSPISKGSLPPPAKQGSGKCTTAAMLLDTIKDVEMAISCRKGRSGTAAGDVAFPKGKENLASVLKRYKRRLSTSKPVGSPEALHHIPASAPYGS